MGMHPDIEYTLRAQDVYKTLLRLNKTTLGFRIGGAIDSLDAVFYTWGILGRIRKSSTNN